MIATAWDDIPQTPGPQEISLSGKLHIERLELSTKIEKLKTFMTMNPAFKELNYEHKELLEEQLNTMNKYENILVQRMILLNQPEIEY
jgi:hypothetical protein